MMTAALTRAHPAITPAIAILAVIAAIGLHFHLGAQPWADNIFPSPWDKLAHAILYFTLTLALCLRYPRSAVFLAVALIGLADEALQSLQAYRHADILDWLADALAAACACLLLHVLSILRTPAYSLTPSNAIVPPFTSRVSAVSAPDCGRAKSLCTKEC